MSRKSGRPQNQFVTRGAKVQNKICKHLRHPREVYVTDGLDRGQPHSPGIMCTTEDETTIDLCGWFVGRLHSIPTPLLRHAGTAMRDGDCDNCPCFEPIHIAIPGVQS